MPGEMARHEAVEAAPPVSQGSAGLLAVARSRWLWLIAGAAVIAALLYAARPWGEDSPGHEWLYGGRRFPAEQSEQIEAALRAAQIPCVLDDGKIGVPPGRKSEAFSLLAKSGLEPESLDKLLDDEVNAASIFDTSEQASRRLHRSFERAAAVVIRKVPGVAKADVVFREIDTGTALNPRRQLKATAFIDLDRGYLLNSAIERKIRDIVMSFGDIRADDVNVLVPGAPAETPGDSIAKVPPPRREDELASLILQRLQIDGARVVVHVEAAPPAPESPGEQLVANRPIEADIADTPTAEPSANHPAVSLAESRTTVLVSAPRSHFRKLYAREHPKEVPTLQEMEPIVARVGEEIRTVVADLVPRDTLADVRIELFDDLAPIADSAAAPVPSPVTHLVIPRWAPIAGGVGLAVAVLALCTGWAASRRPVRSPDLSRHARTPPPRSLAWEKATESVRVDPAAAASVLHNWIAQGGRLS